MKTLSVLRKITIAFFITLLPFVGAPVPDIQAQGSNEAEMWFDHVFDLGVQALPHMLQDNDGFLWIASRGGGLFRYDGDELRNYAPSPDGLTNGDIRGIIEDPQNPDVLWIGTLGGGLNRFDKAAETFTSFQHNPDDPTSLMDDSVWYMIQDGSDSDILWLITYAGLEKFDKNTGIATHYKQAENSSNAPNTGTTWRVIEDYQAPDILWIAYWGGGFDMLNKTTQIFTHYTHDPNDPHSLGAEDNVVTAIVQDTDDPNIIWLGTAQNGLDRFDKTAGTFTHYVHNRDDPDSIRQGMIASIFDDGQGRLWLGGWGEPTGLALFDKKFETFAQYNHDPNDPRSLDNDFINNVYEDRSGILWITTFPGQIEKYEPHTHNFALFQKDPANPDNPAGLSDNVVVSIYEDRQSQIWIGTQGGLDRFDPTSGIFTHYRHMPDDPDSLDVDYIQNLFEDSEGSFWVSLFLGPLVVFDRESGHVTKRYSPIGDGVDSYTQVIEDPDNPKVLWMGTRGGRGGLVRFDKASGDFTFYRNDPDYPENGPASESVYLVFQDTHEDVIWLGSEFGGGFSKFDKKSEIFTHYSHDPDNPNSISSGAVVSIYQDSADILWLGTKGGGLEKFNKRTQTFSHYFQEHGIPPNVNKILKDDRGLFWLSTSNGILRFNPATETVEQQYLEVDGLQGDAFFFGSGVKTQDGQMWFGGTNGANSFHPDRLTTNSYIPPVVLTALTQGGDPLSPDKVPQRLEEIRLDWQHNFFEFEYAALNFTIPEKNQYRYMLEGFDREWYQAGTRRFGRYSGLPGGNYTLRIIGSNNDGVWNEQGHSLKVTVVPPFWQTWWFRSLLTLVVVGGVLGTVGLRIRSIEVRRQQLQTLVDERTKELQEATIRAEVANQAKSAFLTSMSHELRTPLNAILGYAQILQRRPLDPEVIKGLNIVQRSGEHLLTLINDILDIAKIEAGRMELYPAEIDFRNFLEHIASIIRARAEAKGLTFSYERLDAFPMWVEVDETRLRQVLLNLLDNAIKFTDEGSVTLRVKCEDVKREFGHHASRITFHVQNTGIAIAPDQVERIFQPFEQLRDLTHRTKGTGLGLPISRQLVRLMGGDIHVQSEPGQGSTFWFELALPVTEVTLEASQPPDRLITSYQGPRRTVLVVDDVPSNRTVLIDLLEPLGFDVVAAADGQQAIHLAREIRPDLILMDRWMPVLDGFGAAQQIRQNSELQGMSIIAVSASVSKEDQAQSREAGIDAFLPKPIHWPRLAALLEKHLGLEWEYKHERREKGRERPEQGNVLVPPSQEEMAILYDLARKGDMRGIRERAAHIETLGKPYVPFAHRLSELARGFEERELLALIERYMDRVQWTQG